MLFLDNLFTIVTLDSTDCGFRATLRCNPEHLIYKVHFPGNPITPGACLLQTVAELMQRQQGRPLYLQGSKNVKYLNVLIPADDKEVTFAFSGIAETEAGCKAQVVVADDSIVYTKMSLSFSYEAL